MASAKRPAKAKKTVSVARQAALNMLRQVMAGQSLASVQPSVMEALADRRDRALAGELVNGVLRWRWQLEFFVSRLLRKALKARDGDVQQVLLLALYELQQGRAPDYAVIHDAVEMVRQGSGHGSSQGSGKGGGKPWAASLVNAVLRRYTREQAALLAAVDTDEARYAFPAWLLERVRADWPADWQRILQASNRRPPLWLRVNAAMTDAREYRDRLAAQAIPTETSPLCEQALKLGQGLDVRNLPGFADGVVSVQDAGAQLAAGLLRAEKGQRVLDLCAAPGGKTCHLLEREPGIDLFAVELEEDRMARVRENLDRLRLQAGLKVADARHVEQWWSGEPFDRILLDAPCSATGVIRRHPDIKSLRRASDIDALQSLQSEILDAAWQALGEGGELLYVTCSLLAVENAQQVAAFLSRHADAEEIPIQADWGVACVHGRQLLPGEQDADGFYYCRLRKKAV